MEDDTGNYSTICTCTFGGLSGLTTGPSEVRHHYLQVPVARWSAYPQRLPSCWQLVIGVHKGLWYEVRMMKMTLQRDELELLWCLFRDLSG